MRAMLVILRQNSGRKKERIKRSFFFCKGRSPRRCFSPRVWGAFFAAARLSPLSLGPFRCSR